MVGSLVGLLLLLNTLDNKAIEQAIGKPGEYG
jgi:hypothetical protein